MKIIHLMYSSQCLQRTKQILKKLLALSLYYHRHNFPEAIRDVPLVPSTWPLNQKCDSRLTKGEPRLQWLRASKHKSIAYNILSEHTISRCRKTQVFHSIFHKFSKLLSLWPPVEVQSLLRYFLSCFTRVSGTFSAQPSGPLHALSPQQGVVRLVAGRGVAVVAPVMTLVLAVFGVFPFLHTDWYLRLERKRILTIRHFREWW